MLVIKDHVSKSTSYGLITIGIIIGSIPIMAGEFGPYTFFLIAGILCVGYGILMLFNRKHGYTIDESGITDLYRGKKYLFSELGFYRHEVMKHNFNESDYIHIYDHQSKRLFTINLPGIISPEPIIEYLAKYLKKYQWK